MFKSINSKFLAIAILLIALFGMGYIALLYSFQQQSGIYSQIDVADDQKSKITILSETFHRARFWEQVIIRQASPEAEKNFTLLLQDMRENIRSLKINLSSRISKDELESVIGKIDSYENMITRIVQLKTEERLLDTKLSGLFQSMTATILQEKNPELLRPMFTVAHFFINYMNNKQDSQRKALLLVTNALEMKVKSLDVYDIRLIDYMQNFRNILESNYTINHQIRGVSDEVESVSVKLDTSFERFVDTFRQGIEELLAEADKTKANIQFFIPFIVLVSIFLLLIIIYLLKNHIINPINAIAVTMAEVEKGNRSARFDTQHGKNDEINDVGISLNKMLEAIEEQDRVLVAYQDTLEKQLEELSRQKTEQEKLTLQLQRAEKMEAIGTLAGGVAHDLNNILSGIVSYPELLLLDIDKDSPLRKPILTIQESGNKAAAIVQDLLTLARRGAAVFQTTNLNTIIKNYLQSPECKKLTAAYPSVELEADLDENLFNIKGSPIHLLKTIMNLVTNGIEAIEGEGRLTIQTENRHISQQFIGYDQIEEGDYAVVQIKDTGKGIEQDDLEKIFEPFFSKKRMGRSGSGLGLAVVWGTIKDHKGYIDLYSNEKEGTTFTLLFPITRDEVESDLHKKTVEVNRGKGETVLVVDDIESQREIATSILTKLGYTVLSAPNGEEAVKMIQQQPMDLVVLDMIMPMGMDGLDTYKKIQEINPDQRVIIASGYSESGRVHEARKLGVFDYIRKPYSLEVIGNSVYNAINRQ